MKIHCSKDDLSRGVATIQAALSARTTLPILHNFLMETENTKVKVVSTDLEMGVKHYIAAEVAGDGSITIPAKKFADILHSLPDGEDVDLTVDVGGKVLLKCGRVRFNIIGAPKSEYPVLPEFIKQNAFEMAADDVREMVEKTLFATSTDETRHVLNGVYWTARKGQLDMVATDGRRLAFISKKAIPVDRDFQVIVPAKVLGELERLLNAAKASGNMLVSVTDNQISFQFQETTLISRLVSGSFPNYQQLFQGKKEVVVTLGTQELLATTRRAALCTLDRGGSVRITLHKGAMQVQSSSQTLEFNDEIAVDYSGPEFKIAFNPQFMADAIKHVDSEKLTISFTTPVLPTLVEPVGGGDYRFVIMPMRA